jgi:hypothetical protein
MKEVFLADELAVIENAYARQNPHIEVADEDLQDEFLEDGGPGSGDFGHGGRPGKVGGSSKGGGKAIAKSAGKSSKKSGSGDKNADYSKKHGFYGNTKKTGIVRGGAQAMSKGTTFENAGAVGYVARTLGRKFVGNTVAYASGGILGAPAIRSVQTATAIDYKRTFGKDISQSGVFNRLWNWGGVFAGGSKAASARANQIMKGKDEAMFQDAEDSLTDTEKAFLSRLATRMKPVLKPLADSKVHQIEGTKLAVASDGSTWNISQDSGKTWSKTDFDTVATVVGIATAKEK